VRVAVEAPWLLAPAIALTATVFVIHALSGVTHTTSGS